MGTHFERYAEVSEILAPKGFGPLAAATLRAEPDYLRKGRNAERFASNCANDSSVHIPKESSGPRPHAGYWPWNGSTARRSTTPKSAISSSTETDWLATAPRPRSNVLRGWSFSCRPHPATCLSNRRAEEDGSTSAWWAKPAGSSGTSRKPAHNGSWPSTARRSAQSPSSAEPGLQPRHSHQAVCPQAGLRTGISPHSPAQAVPMTTASFRRAATNNRRRAVGPINDNAWSVTQPLRPRRSTIIGRGRLHATSPGLGSFYPVLQTFLP